MYRYLDTKLHLALYSGTIPKNSVQETMVDGEIETIILVTVHVRHMLDKFYL